MSDFKRAISSTSNHQIPTVIAPRAPREPWGVSLLFRSQSDDPSLCDRAWRMRFPEKPSREFAGPAVSVPCHRSPLAWPAPLAQCLWKSQICLGRDPRRQRPSTQKVRQSLAKQGIQRKQTGTGDQNQGPQKRKQKNHKKKQWARWNARVTSTD
jgi:hypothetical protein